MAETIGNVYGKWPRAIVALFNMGSSITMVTMQIHVMSLSIRMCIHSVNPDLITISSTLILIFYSSFGGIRAVTFTDVLQFITFSVILPFLAWRIFVKVGKPFTEIFPLLQEQEKFQFGTLFHCDMNPVAMIALILSILVSYIDTPIIHRVYMSSDATQARKVFQNAGFFGIFINIIICLIGLLTFVGTSTLSAVKGWDYIMAGIPPFFHGLLSVSLLAMSMSAADSCLHSGAIAVSHDMLESIRSVQPSPYPYQLRFARIASICIGLLAMALTFYYDNLLDLLKLNLGLYLPITVAPFILSIFGFRGTTRTALIGMATGLFTILAWNKWVEPSTAINGSFVAMVANGLTIMAARYLLKQPENTGMICLKSNLVHAKNKTLYLENQEEIRKLKPLNTSLYDSDMAPTATAGNAKGYRAILTQIIGKIEASIPLVDSGIPPYKQDLQRIIHKLYDWVTSFSRRDKAQDHALLQPTKVRLDKLMDKVELALSQAVANPPRLLVEKINTPSGEPSSYMVCDINQIVYLLVQAILRIGKLEASQAVSIQLHNTALQFKQDAIDSSLPTYIRLQATALVISQATTVSKKPPKVNAYYDDSVDPIAPKGQQKAPPSIDLQQETISTIVRAHYGYFKLVNDQKQPTTLLVLPNDVTDILSKMTTKRSIGCLTSKASISLKEQADSMMALMQFHDAICKSPDKENPIDRKTISSLLVLLRQHFGFKRHASDQLFYVRAVGIAELVLEWGLHTPKLIYATLLYALVQHSYLSLTYIKAHYNIAVYAFVSNMVNIDKRQALDHPALLYIQHRLKKAIQEDHVQLSVLFIKLAERLYDLRHAAGYIHLAEVHHMAQETLAIDVKLARAYLGPEIEVALEQAAKQALGISKNASFDF